MTASSFTVKASLRISAPEADPQQDPRADFAARLAALLSEYPDGEVVSLTFTPTSKSLQDIGLGPQIIPQLVRKGIETAQHLASLTSLELLEVPGVNWINHRHIVRQMAEAGLALRGAPLYKDSLESLELYSTTYKILRNARVSTSLQSPLRFAVISDVTAVDLISMRKVLGYHGTEYLRSALMKQDRYLAPVSPERTVGELMATSWTANMAKSGLSKDTPIGSLTLQQLRDMAGPGGEYIIQDIIFELKESGHDLGGPLQNA